MITLRFHDQNQSNKQLYVDKVYTQEQIIIVQQQKLPRKQVCTEITAGSAELSGIKGWGLQRTIQVRDTQKDVIKKRAKRKKDFDTYTFLFSQGLSYHLFFFFHVTIPPSRAFLFLFFLCTCQIHSR